MTPLMQFRSWTRDGAVGERVGGVVVAALVIALLAWALLPVAGAPDATVAGAEPASSATPTTSAQAVDSVPSPTASSSRVDAGSDAGSSDAGPPATASRASESSVGGAAVAAASPSTSLVGRYYEVFLLDPSAPRAACLKAQEDRIFVMFNNLDNCVVQAGIPNFWALNPSQSTVRQFFPCIMTFQADYERLARDFVLGGEQVGFFDGMAKLGLLEHSCSPDRTRAVRANLTRIGIRPEQMSVYNYGCPSTLPTVGPLDLSFPAGPANFRDPGNPTGSQFWRPVIYHADCTCVRLLDQTFRPEFR